MNNPAVFISSSTEGLPIATELGRLLQATIDCTIWSQGIFNPGQTIIESLSETADRVDFAVFILTPDDRTKTRGEAFHSPRDNLLFEIGFLAGAIGISRTIIIVVGDRTQLKLPSDLAGVLYLNMPAHAPLDMAHAAHEIEKAIRDIQPRKTEEPTNFYSCFISYSWGDKRFARRLHDDLQTVGVRCWLDEKDLEVGQSLMTQIDRGMQAHDKVLLVISDASVRSSWVNAEIDNALRLEQARNKTVLFPIYLDDAIISSETPRLTRVKDKYMLDFRDWEDDNSYQRAFSRLVRGLALSASVESGGPS